MKLNKATLLLLALCLCYGSIVADPADPDADTDTEEVASINVELTENLAATVVAITAAKTAVADLTDANAIRKKAMDKGKAAIDEVATLIATLSDDVESINTKLADDLKAKVETTLTDLNTWKTDEVKLVDEGTGGYSTRDANSQVNLLIQKYKNSLNSNVEQIEKAQVAYERELKKVNTGLNTDKLEKAITDCPKMSPAKCQADVDKALTPFKTATNSLKQLLKQTAPFLATIEKSTTNVTKLTENLEADKDVTKAKLTAMIEKNGHRATTTTTTEKTE